MRRFFDAGNGRTLEELAAVCGAELRGEGNVRVLALATLEEARESDLSFFDNPRYTSLLPSCAAGAVIVPIRHLPLMPSEMPLLIVRDAQRALALAGQALFPSAVAPEPIATVAGISEQAFVDPSARIEAGAIIEPMAVVGRNAEIGRGTIVGCGAVVGPACSIGRECRIGPHASIQYALLGNRVILHPGVRIGQDGFGYAVGGSGILKMVQVGRVIIQDDVEIGANTTVDRGAIRDTVIGENTKIDNQVQIAHNVRIGCNCIIVSQVGISGSVTIGDGVAIGGQTGINGHVTIGNGAQIAAVSTVAGDVPPGARWGGTPARPVREWIREMAMLRNMAKAGRGSGGDDGRRDEDA